MKKFNINSYMYVQITEHGWDYLRETVGEDYIRHCITADGYKCEINGETWYRLQCHSVFELMPIKSSLRRLFNTNVLFDDVSLFDIERNVSNEAYPIK